MVTTVKKIDDNGNIKVDGKDTTVDKQNNKYLDHPTVKEYKEFFDYFWSRPKPNEKGPNGEEVFFSGDEYVREMAKHKKLNLNLWAKIDQGLHDGQKAETHNWKCNRYKLWNEQSEDKMKKMVEDNEKDFKENHLPWIEEMIVDMKQFKRQLEDTGNTYEDTGNDYNDPNKDKSQEELKRRAAEIEAYRNKVKGEIEKFLNEDPQITSAELDPKCRNWQEQIWNTIIATGEKEIENIKDRVLTDITIKRTAKQAEKAKDGNDYNEYDKLTDETRSKALKKITEALEQARLSKSDLSADCQNWREQIDLAGQEQSVTKIEDIQNKVLADINNRKEQSKKNEKAKDAAVAQELGNKTLEEIDKMGDNELAESLALFTRWEGEKEIKDSENLEKAKEVLKERNPALYREKNIEAIKQRIGDYGIDEKGLSQLTRELISGEITDLGKFDETILKVINEVGEKGAESKWTSLFNQAKSLLEKAKKNVTEQIKKDIKAIQEQLKGLKEKSNGANSYLTSYYQKDKANVEKLEKDLAASLSNSKQTDSPKKTPWGAIIPLSLVAVALVTTVAIVIVRRRRKQNRIKK